VSRVRDIPWLPYAAADFIEKVILAPSSRVFEYGSGGSTIWLAKQVGSLVSVEDDPDWYDFVRVGLTEYGVLSKCEYLLRPKLEGKGFRKYIRAIDNRGLFDVVFVDGPERGACLRRAKPKIKSGAYMILDNPDTHVPPEGLFEDWECYKFYGYGMDPKARRPEVYQCAWHCWIWKNV